MPAMEGRAESVHLNLFPKSHDIYGEEVSAAALKALAADWTMLMSVREEAMKALEVARQSKEIGSSLEAQVKISAPEAAYDVLKKYGTQLRALLIVSGIQLKKAASTNGGPGVRVEVSRAQGEKCERCWNYSVHVGENKEYPTICERCSAALQESAKA
jgi:isoleucyl-tRNA synthetase